MISRKFALTIAVGLTIAAISCKLQPIPAATVSPTATATPDGVLSPTPLIQTVTPGLTDTPAGQPATQVPPPIPTATWPPVSAATQPAAGASGATRVTFTTGATFATVNGNLAANGTARYLVNVAAGQLIDVSSSSTPQPQITVTGADGKILQNVLKNAVVFRGVAPSTQDYTITLTGGAQAMTYSVEIMIPERITFARGDTAAIMSGSVAADSVHQYVISLEAGQLLDLTLSPTQSGQTGIHTQIYGVDGDVLQSGMGGGAGFRGTMPSSQDYVIEVVSEGSAVMYSMTVIVAQRITFAAGATSATLTGSLKAHETHHFIINARADQTLDVAFTPEGSARMSIYGVDGSVLWSGMGEGTHFNGKLPSTQDYYINFQAGDQTVQFQLVVTIK